MFEFNPVANRKPVEGAQRKYGPCLLRGMQLHFELAAGLEWTAGSVLTCKELQ